MKLFISFVLCIVIAVCFSLVFADDGTINAPAQGDNIAHQGGSGTHPTDDVYVITPFESVCVSNTSTWQDNRHRAYYSTSILGMWGCLLFDVSQIPDTDIILNMTLKCYLENAFGSPNSNPVVDIYWCPQDNWTRSTAGPGSIAGVDLLVNSVPFNSYIPDYTFNINVAGHNWMEDLADNRICLGFKNDVTYYSYVYFFGAYGTPTGPAPELTITTSPGTPLDLEVLLTPVGLPITLPASGGTLEFNIEVTNNEPTVSNASVWTMVTLPNGTEYGPLINVFMNFAPNFNGNRDRFQAVPSSAPSGNYTYDAYVGAYPSVIWDEDHFEFSKSPVDNGGTIVSDWENWGESFDDLSGISDNFEPESFVLHEAFPNPFNPVTSIEFDLVESVNVHLAVYDISGRLVAILVDGLMPSGAHTASFNGANLSSGVYLINMTAGHYNASKKVVLMK